MATPQDKQSDAKPSPGTGQYNTNTPTHNSRTAPGLRKSHSQASFHQGLPLRDYRDFSPAENLIPRPAVKQYSPYLSKYPGASIGPPYSPHSPSYPSQSPAYSPTYSVGSPAYGSAHRPRLARPSLLGAIAEAPSSRGPETSNESPTQHDPIQLQPIQNVRRVRHQRRDLKKSHTEGDISTTTTSTTRPTSHHHRQDSASTIVPSPQERDLSQNMLSINFGASHMEETRDAKISRLRDQNPVWNQCREVQNSLEAIRMKLNHAPGVSALLLKEVGDDIQQTGQVLNRAVMDVVKEWAKLTVEASELKHTISNWNHASEANQKRALEQRMEQLEQERNELDAQVAKLELEEKKRQAETEEHMNEIQRLNRSNLDLKCRTKAYRERVENMQEEGKAMVNEFKNLEGLSHDEEAFEAAKDALFKKICGQISNRESLFSLLDPLGTPPPNNNFHLLEQNYKAWRTKEFLEKQMEEGTDDTFSDGMAPQSENPPSSAPAPSESANDDDAYTGALVPTTPSDPLGNTRPMGNGPDASGAGNGGSTALQCTHGLGGLGGPKDPTTPTPAGPSGLGYGGSGATSGYGNYGGNSNAQGASGNFGGRNMNHGTNGQMAQLTGPVRANPTGPNIANMGRNVGRNTSQSNAGMTVSRAESVFQFEGTLTHVPRAIHPSPYPPPGTRTGPRRAPSAQPGNQTRFRPEAVKFRPSSMDRRNMTFAGGPGGPGGRFGEPLQYGAPGTFASPTTANFPSPNFTNGPGYSRPAVASRMGSTSALPSPQFGGNNGVANNNINSPLAPGSSGATIENVDVGYQGFVREAHEMYAELYRLTRGWVGNYVSSVDNRQTLVIKNTPTYQLMLGCYRPMTATQAAAYIDVHLRESVFRPCLMSRLVVDFFVNRIWTVPAWMGYNHQADTSLENIHHEIGRTNIAGFRRQQLVDSRADIISSIATASDYENFREARITYYCDEIGSLVEPLINRLADRSRAQSDMRLVVEQAWDIARLIALSRVQWNFRYPSVGDRFSPTSMQPVYPHKPAQDLHVEHWRVGLVVSPVITMTRDTGGSITVHDLYMADVVCMQ